VISKHRSRADVSESWADSNLREPMLDILKRAEIKPWPKLFHAMRASCETDLVKSGYQLKDVTVWMGHSYKVAETHYLRTQEEEFARAVKNGAKKPDNNESHINNNLKTQDTNNFPSTKKTVQKPGLQAAAGHCTTEPRNAKSPCFTGFCESVQHGAIDEIGQVGLLQLYYLSGNNHFFKNHWRNYWRALIQVVP